MDADEPLIRADEGEIGAIGRDDGRYPHSGLTQRIIGAAMAVHSELGPGFLEKVYETALAYELETSGIRFRAQSPIPVVYKKQPVGMYFADLLVEDAVICEIKAIEALQPAHEVQIVHYLKATGIPVGLLLNFGSRRLQVRRRVSTR
jgi:GxxExxY protein